MADHHRVGWIFGQARQGAAELPANVAWLLGKVAGGAESSHSSRGGSNAGGRTVRDVVADALPFGKDSLDLRIQRAHEALSRARQAQQDATDQAVRAREDADEAAAVAERGRRRHAQVKKDGEAEVARRLKEAQRRADELVAREREAAEAAAAKTLDKTDEEIERDNLDAQSKADASRERAQADLDDARAQMVEARRLADEAASEARSAAEEARRNAEELARDADAKVAATDDLEREVGSEAVNVVNASPGNGSVSALNQQSKGELLELATTLGVAGRSQMNKDELVKAVRTASKKTAAARR